MYVCLPTVQLNSHLTLALVFFAGIELLSKLVSRLRVHERISGNLWQMTLMRHFKLLEQSPTVFANDTQVLLSKRQN